MGLDLSDVKEKTKYKIQMGDKTFEVEGEKILSALCPACGGSGQVNHHEAEPTLCEICQGMGMVDYSQAEITPA